LLERFCFGFCFFLPSYFFPHLAGSWETPILTCFVFDFVLSDLLLSFGGIFGKFWFCAFLFIVPYFANFWISPISQNFSFWLVFVLSCQLDHGRAAAKPTIGARQRRLWQSMVGGQPFTHLNPPTSDLFLLPPHTTAHLQPNHTLLPHNRTLPHTRPSGGHGRRSTRTDLTHMEERQALSRVPRGRGAEKDHTRSGDTGGGRETTLARINVGGETSASTHF